MLYFSSKKLLIERKIPGSLRVWAVKFSQNVLSWSFLSIAPKNQNKHYIIHRLQVQKAKIIIQLILIISYGNLILFRKIKLVNIKFNIYTCPSSPTLLISKFKGCFGANSQESLSGAEHYLKVLLEIQSLFFEIT